MNCAGSTPVNSIWAGAAIVGDQRAAGAACTDVEISGLGRGCVDRDVVDPNLPDSR
jgi:hypothetical protein